MEKYFLAKSHNNSHNTSKIRQNTTFWLVEIASHMWKLEISLKGMTRHNNVISLLKKW